MSTPRRLQLGYRRDARGTLIEPHIGRQVELGTLEVRRYLKSWSNNKPTGLLDGIDELFPTSGPAKSLSVRGLR